MSSVASAIGLHAGASCHAPYYLMFNFLYAYCALASRTYKQYLKLDHNISPREDLAKYGDKAVQSGKITQAQLNMLKRTESAHANRVENFTVFAASTVLAVAAGVPYEVVNASCLVYTLSSLAYGPAYILVEQWKHTWLRSLSWWIGNDACLYLLYRAGKALNSKKALDS